MEDNVYAIHNHNDCINTALEHAVKICKQKNARLTATRKQVLKFIWESHKPIGAYDLLPKLGEAGFNSAPPTVYRALDFLLEMQLIHRINSLNAFIGCSNPEEHHANCFFICKTCGVAQEINSSPLNDMCLKLEKDLGLQVDEQITEFSGICPECQNTH